MVLHKILQDGNQRARTAEKVEAAVMRQPDGKSEWGKGRSVAGKGVLEWLGFMLAGGAGEPRGGRAQPHWQQQHHHPKDDEQGEKFVGGAQQIAQPYFEGKDRGNHPKGVADAGEGENEDEEGDIPPLRPCVAAQFGERRPQPQHDIFMRASAGAIEAEGAIEVALHLGGE